MNLAKFAITSSITSEMAGDSTSPVNGMLRIVDAVSWAYGVHPSMPKEFHEAATIPAT